VFGFKDGFKRVEKKEEFEIKISRKYISLD